MLHFDDAGAVYTLRLTNGAEPLSIVAGAPCDEEQAASATDGATRWYLPFPFVIPESTVAALAWSATGWIANAYAFRGRTLWGFAPKADATLPPGGAIDFTLSGLGVPSQPQLPALNLTASWYADSPATGLEISFAVPIAPNPSMNSLVPSIESPTNVVYLSQTDEQYPNTVMVAVQNGPTPLPLGTSSVVTIELPVVAVAAPESGAITTAAYVEEIGCSVVAATENASWSVDSATPIVPGNVAWQLTPGSDPALPAGGTLIVELTGIISPAPLSGGTVVRVESTGFAGFADSVTECTAVVEPLPAAVFSSAAVVGDLPLGYDVPLEIAWATQFATSLTLEYDDGISDYTLTSSANSLPLSGTRSVQSTTVDAQVRLTASNVKNGGTVQDVAVPVAPSPTPTFSVAVTPAAWDFGAGPVDVTYTLSAAPLRLLTALTVAGSSGTVSLMGRTTYTVSQSSPAAPVFAATFAAGVGQAPRVVTVSPPAIPSLAAYVVGTSWLGQLGQDADIRYTFTDAENAVQRVDAGDEIPTLTSLTYSVSNNVITLIDPAPDAVDRFVNSLTWTPPTLHDGGDGEPMTRVS